MGAKSFHGLEASNLVNVTIEIMQHSFLVSELGLH
jgi:hypothetical protein